MIGKERYNQKDQQKAKELLKEAGYNGEEVTFLVSRAYEDHYKAAVSVQSQLKEVGLNIKLDVYDWATMLTHRQNPEAWDLFGSGFTYEPHPVNNIWLNPATEYPGWTENEKMDEAIKAIRESDTSEEAKEHFETLQDEYYDYVPVVKYGDYATFYVTRTSIKGNEYSLGHILWNTTKE